MNDVQPSWDFYRTFLAVLQHGSLSAAARELGLTQPTVGRHVDALEQALGSELFTRSPQGLLPTEAALAIRPYAAQLASTAASLLRTASGSRGKVDGTVRISASEVVGVEVLPPILATLQEQYPELGIELSLSDNVEDLLQREADIAVRMVAPSQDALLARRLGDIKLGLYAHKTYLERHGTPHTLPELAGHRLIGFDRPLPYIRAMLKKMPELKGARFAFRSDSNLAQLAAIRSGNGIGTCQTGIARRDPNLVRLLQEDFELPMETWLAMHENLKTSPRCRVTFDALASGLANYIRQAADHA